MTDLSYPQLGVEVLRHDQVGFAIASDKLDEFVGRHNGTSELILLERRFRAWHWNPGNRIVGGVESLEEHHTVDRSEIRLRDVREQILRYGRCKLVDAHAMPLIAEI